MQLEPVQAAEELKILKMFVAFDLPKVRCDTNYYAELLPSLLCLRKRYMDHIWVWRHRSLTKDFCVFFLSPSYIVNEAVATSTHSFTFKLPLHASHVSLPM